jgi:hypothetical protein
MVAPHVIASLSGYFAGYYVPTDSLAHAAASVWGEIDARLSEALGSWGWLASAAALLIACHLHPPLRPPALAVGLLVLEMIALGMTRQFPFAAPRVMLFMYTALAVVLAIGLGCALTRLATRRFGLACAIAVGGFVLVSAVSAHDWDELGESPRIEDAGPLIRRVEAERTPDDVVLVYGRTVFVYAYYQRATPVLIAARNSTGFAPVGSDPRVRLVDRASVAPAAIRAFAEARVVWFVGSRMGVDAGLLERALTERGRLTDRDPRIDALLLRLERRAPS